MSTLKPKKRAWLWVQRIPFGAITLLTGKKGAGKSSLGSEIAACATSGRQLPGNPRLPPMNVLLIVREEEVEIEPRARAEEQGADLARLFVLPPTDPLPWAHVRDRVTRMQERNAWLAEQFRRHHIRLLLVDPISSLMVHETGNALRDELTDLTILLAKYKVACLGIIHLTKSWGGTIDNTIRGGGQWSQVARLILAVARLDPREANSAIVFGVVETNYAAGNVPYLAYSLEPHPTHRERVRLVWVDDDKLPPRISLDDLVKEACREGRTLATKGEQVREVLAEILANGVQLREAEVKAEVKARLNVSDRTIEEAKRKLGGHSDKRGNVWYWDLPLPVDIKPVPEGEVPVPPTGTTDGTGAVDGTPGTPDIAASLPVTDFIEAQRRKGKSASEIAATLKAAAARSQGGKTASEQDAEQTTDTNATETEKKRE